MRGAWLQSHQRGLCGMDSTAPFIFLVSIGTYGLYLLMSAATNSATNQHQTFVLWVNERTVRQAVTTRCQRLRQRLQRHRQHLCSTPMAASRLCVISTGPHIRSTPANIKLMGVTTSNYSGYNQRAVNTSAGVAVGARALKQYPFCLTHACWLAVTSSLNPVVHGGCHAVSMCRRCMAQHMVQACIER